MFNYNIQHITQYIYPEPATYIANQIKLFPINNNYQKITHHIITITENPGLSITTDFLGNKMGTFTIVKPLKELIINSEFNVQTFPTEIIKITQTVEEHWAYLISLNQEPQFYDFLKVEPSLLNNEFFTFFEINEYQKFYPAFITKKINEFIFKNFQYQKGITTVETTIDEIWKIKSGVCQDFSHIMLSILRLLKIPCRYVSGYICSEKNQLRGDGATHAWVDVYLPEEGWVGFDPTNNCRTSAQHVRLAIGRNFNDCSPVKGVYRGPAEHELLVKVLTSNSQNNNECYFEVFNEIKSLHNKNSNHHQ